MKADWSSLKVSAEYFLMLPSETAMIRISMHQKLKIPRADKNTTSPVLLHLISVIALERQKSTIQQRNFPLK